jgi:hypothetical protein
VRHSNWNSPWDFTCSTHASSSDGTSASMAGCGSVIHVVNNARRPSRFGSPSSSDTYGASPGNDTAFSSASVRCGSRNPASAWNSVSAHTSSGLGVGSG